MNLLTYPPRLRMLIEYSVSLLRKSEKLALTMNPDGLIVGFSGGKDSQVLLDIVRLSGVKYQARMTMTSIDPPEVLRFIRQHYPDVIIDTPRITMRDLILKKGMLPTRRIRFCCKDLKESYYASSVVAVGVRAQESFQRRESGAIRWINHTGHYDIDGDYLVELPIEPSQYYGVEKLSTVHCVGSKDKVVIAPLFYWEESDIWDYIRFKNLPTCSLYREGFKRVGCIFCPMASVAAKRLQLERYPLFRDKYFLPIIRKLMERGKYRAFSSAEEVFNWWMSNKSAADYLKLAQRDNVEPLRVEEGREI